MIQLPFQLNKFLIFVILYFESDLKCMLPIKLNTSVQKNCSHININVYYALFISVGHFDLCQNLTAK